MYQSILRSFVFLSIVVSSIGSLQAQRQQVLNVTPLAARSQARLRPVRSGPLQVPMITWGGDIATILAKENGLFDSAGLSVDLYREDVLQKQVIACLEGKTPFFRGTHSMINAAQPAFIAAGTELVEIYQLTWSRGGDCLVVRDSIKTPADLKGKTIALQLDGPHQYYLANVLTSAGIGLNEVNLKFFRELYLPNYETKEIVDPVSAFEADPTIDAVMCISPDMLRLTSNGTVGNGSEGSVKGARNLISTLSASKIIADVYAVRKDYLDSHRSEMEKFVRTLLKAQEDLQTLVANKASREGEYKKLVSQAGLLLLDSANATSDVEGLLADCEYVGYAGNVAFFTAQGTTRNINTITDEVQTAFIELGLMTARAHIGHAEWDYNALSKGLANAGKVASAPKFDTSRAQAKIEQAIQAEATSWETDGTLFVIEINFAPNQSEFSAQDYADDFKKAMEISETYSGAIVTIEGHSDPLGVLRMRKARKAETIIAQTELAAKNLSQGRASAVRDAYLSYVSESGVNVDQSQFFAVGVGVAAPKFNPPRTKDEWEANRRVVFRIKQVEAELSEFVPLN